MAENFSKYLFTESVKAAQEKYGSRAVFEKIEGPDQDELYDWETDFISQRDSFYIATINEDGWPYVQFKGGSKGFLKVLDSKTLGYADFRGNRQYVSAGNLNFSGKTSLILVDYAQQIRLKILAIAEVLPASDYPDLKDQLVNPDYEAVVERFVIFHLKAFDRNCYQHIMPKYTLDEIQKRIIEDPTFKEKILG